MKQCTKCKEFLSESMFNKSNRKKSGLRSECRDCQHKDHKTYYSNPLVIKRKSEYRQIPSVKTAYRISDKKRNATEHRRKYKSSANTDYWPKKKAHDAVHIAIKNGSMVRSDCEYIHHGDCSGNIQAHHEDYDKPLDVRWLCVRHHKLVHMHKIK